MKNKVSPQTFQFKPTHQLGCLLWSVSCLVWPGHCSFRCKFATRMPHSPQGSLQEVATVRVIHKSLLTHSVSLSAQCHPHSSALTPASLWLSVVSAVTQQGVQNWLPELPAHSPAPAIPVLGQWVAGKQKASPEIGPSGHWTKIQGCFGQNGHALGGLRPVRRLMAGGGSRKVLAPKFLLPASPWAGGPRGAGPEVQGWGGRF